MFEMSGRYGSAKVFTDLCEPSAIKQIQMLLNNPIAKNAHMRFMPDVHGGAGCVIGTTFYITDSVAPALVGVDIGCGMEVTPFSAPEGLKLEELDALLHERGLVSSGCGKTKEMERLLEEVTFADLLCPIGKTAKQKFGSMGGGNHFVEVDRNKNGQTYLVIHSGSRSLGVDVCKYYQQIAANQPENADVSEDLACLRGEAFNAYLHDMKIAQTYAALNRKAMSASIINMMGWQEEPGGFTTVHNYIDTDARILRKGAVSAKAGERLIIPLSMRDGAIIAIGKGNPDWNYSAPHGAGRLMSRSTAKATLSLDDFKKSMEGIFTSCVSPRTIDESPMAYKPAEAIIENVADTVDVLEVITPIYNFKG